MQADSWHPCGTNRCTQLRHRTRAGALGRRTPRGTACQGLQQPSGRKVLLPAVAAVPPSLQGSPSRGGRSGRGRFDPGQGATRHLAPGRGSGRHGSATSGPVRDLPYGARGNPGNRPKPTYHDRETAPGQGVRQAPEFRMVLKQPAVLPTALTPPDLHPKTGLSVTWLGTSSGAPTLDRNVSCTVVRTERMSVLVDCGEGSYRQLAAAGVPLDSVAGIYITHLHGDHCFGLGSVLAGIDAAKRAWRAAAGPETRGKGLRHITHVIGPPGVLELLRAQLVMTGLLDKLTTRISVTELVSSAHDAMAAAPAPGPSTPALQLKRLAPTPLAQCPGSVELAARLAGPAVKALPQIWRPRSGAWVQSSSTGRNTRHRTTDGRMSDSEAEALYGGRDYVAAPGVVWDLCSANEEGDDGVTGIPLGGLRVMAAQLQHRVPCWGYSFTELRPGSGSSGRKVVILGDTIDSRAMAPLAWGCDLLAHEATFMRGFESKCIVAQHSTAWMAGAFAAAVQAKTLVLTHFSARYHRAGDGERGAIKGRAKDGSLSVQEEAARVAEELRQQNEAVAALIREAQAMYPSGKVLAASDFFHLDVPAQQAAQPWPAAAVGGTVRA